MEEYTQITLNDWVAMKQKLEQELNNVKHSFVRIGYVLRRMDQEKAYELDGYKSITEFAEGCYGLKPSTTSRFMAINREYSLDGYSETLDPKWEEYTRSQMEEMLQLSAADREMIEPSTPRQVIRDLKKFNKEEHDAEEGPSEIEELVKSFLKDNKDITKDIYKAQCPDPVQTRADIKQILIPSGNRSYKKGLFFLVMSEEKVTCKKFAGETIIYGWEQILDIVLKIFPEVHTEQSKAIISTVRTEKKTEPVPVAPAQTEEPEKVEKKEKPKKIEKKEKKEELAKPAKPRVEAKAPLAVVDRIKKTIEKAPEKIPEEDTEIIEPVIDHTHHVTRKMYLDRLTTEEAAKYMFSKNMFLCETLTGVTEWLNTTVDEKTGMVIFDAEM